MLDKQDKTKKWYPDIEKTKKNIHKSAVLENATGSIKANFIVNPEWISECTHELPPSTGRKHAPWSYEYPGAKPRTLENKEMVEDAMIKSLKMKTPRV